MTDTMTDPTAALAAWLGEQKWSSFAQSLAAQYDAKGWLSDKQIAAAEGMRNKQIAKALTGTAPKGGTAAPVGLYLLDGEVYKVVSNKAGTNRYAKRLAGAKSWEYAPGVIYKLAAENLVDHKMAADYGAAKGTCINCGLDIGHGEDQRAAYTGFGEKCAKNNGWPFPTVAEFAALQEAV